MSVTVAPGLRAASTSRSAGLPAQAFAVLAGAFTALSAAWRRHAAAQALAALDARGLADIGVGPGEIEAVVRSGRRGSGAAGAPVAAEAALPSRFTEWR